MAKGANPERNVEADDFRDRSTIAGRSIQENGYIFEEDGMAERVGFKPDQPKKFPSLLIKPNTICC